MFVASRKVDVQESVLSASVLNWRFRFINPLMLFDDVEPQVDMCMLAALLVILRLLRTAVLTKLDCARLSIMHI